MRPGRLSAAGAALAAAGAGYAMPACLPLGDGVPAIDVAYGSDPYQTLAVYPARRGRAATCWSSIHGGGWTNGYKEWMAFMAPAAQRAAASPSSASAIAWRRRMSFPPASTIAPTPWPGCCGRSASTAAIPRRVFVGGHSAGGHYAGAARRDAATGSRRARPARRMPLRRLPAGLGRLSLRRRQRPADAAALPRRRAQGEPRPRARDRAHRCHGLYRPSCIAHGSAISRI